MTSFLDGPAKGVTLMLHRSPKYLRVTRVCQKNKHGDVDESFDALDQLVDEPERSETLFAYRMKEFKGHAHVNMGRGRGSGFYPMVDYELVPEQPGDSIMRDNAKWSEWCGKQPDPIPKV